MMKPDEQLVEQAKMVLDFNWNGEYTLISPSNLILLANPMKCLTAFFTDYHSVQFSHFSDLSRCPNDRLEAHIRAVLEFASSI
jgi:hypothetical protein